MKDLQKAEEKAFKAISAEDRDKFTWIKEALTKALHVAMDVDIYKLHEMENKIRIT